MGRPLGFAPEAALEHLGLPQGGPGVLPTPGTQGSWRLGPQEIQCSTRVSNHYWPVRSNISAWRTSLLAGHSLQGLKESDTSKATLHTQMQDCFCPWQLCPERVEHECGTAAWLVLTLVLPSGQGHGLPLPQELWPYQSLFLPVAALPQ